MAKAKPDKPTPDFPLFPHNNGLWAKKVLGKLHYFGPWADPRAALNRWLDEKDQILAGRKPQRIAGAVTVGQLCYQFLAAKKVLIAKGERSPRYQKDLEYTTDRIVKVFGKSTPVEKLGPADFARLAAEMAKTLGPVARCTEISKTKSVFRYGFDAELIKVPVRFGPDFKAPSRTVIRKHRQQFRKEHGLRMFEAEEIKMILDVVQPELRAMVLLGVNCGLGNSDCAGLSMAHLDLKRGWLDYPRSKTGVERKLPLWPETIEALEEVLRRRVEPRDNAYTGLVFLTRRKRQPYTHLTKTGNPTDTINDCLTVHLNNLKINRRGLSFYCLRHTFETAAGEAKDQIAVDAIMGHVDPSMGAQYREKISDERLRAVTDHVRAWLFGADAKAPEGTAKQTRRHNLKIVG